MKRLTILISLILLFFSTNSPVFAQTQGPTSQNQDVIDMDESAGANIAKFNLDSVSTFWSAAGCTVVNTGCTVDGKPVIKTSALDSTNKVMTALLSNPPVHTATYVADVLNHAGFVQPAYAQGIGFSGLSPVLIVWKAFRNLSYFLFIIIFVVIGFMIMIRKKVSNNAILTVQEALPKIIVTLLLITFSYAIAGLIVDLMYLSIFVITGLFEQAGVLTNASNTQNVIFSKNIIQIGWGYLMGAREVAGTGSEAIGSMITQVFGGFLGTLANGLAYLVIAVAIFIALFRTLIALITAYVGIILSVIFAPIQLLMNAFPGSDSFGKWIKGLFANAAVFPTAVVMIVLGAYLGGTYNKTDAETFGLPVTDNPSGFEHNGFLPPLISDSTYNEGGGGDVGNARAIVGLGMILLLPEVVKLVKEALQVKETDFGGMAFKNAQAGNVLQKPASLVSGVIVSAGTQQLGSEMATRYTNWKKKKATVEVLKKQGFSDKQIEEELAKINKPASPGQGGMG